MAKIIEAEARITALDATADTFSKVAQKVKMLSGSFKAIGGAASSGFGTASKSISRLQSAIQTLAPAASSALAFESMRGLSGLIHATVQAAAERAHEAARMEVAGMTDDEISQADEISQQLSEKYTALSKTTIMHTLRNARSVVGSFEEAKKIIEPMLKMRIAAQGAHPERAAELAEDVDKLVKAMEMKGVTMDPQKFTDYMDGMTKAVNTFGDTLSPSAFYGMFKYGRQATQNLSKQFELETGPTFMQEMGESSTGKALESFYQELVAGQMHMTGAKELEKFGLIDPSKIVKTKTGSIKGLQPGAVIGHGLAATDPYAWVNQIFLPALAKKGVTDPEKIQEEIATIFQRGTTAQLISVLATQQARIEKDWALVRGAKGLESADVFMAKDPYTAMSSVNEQFKNLLTIAGGPLALPAAEGLNAIARGIVAIESATKDHPLYATGSLAASTALLGYGSLRASLWALRGLKNLVSVGGQSAADAAAAAADAGPSFLGTVLGSSAMRYGLGPLGMLLGSTSELNAGEKPLLPGGWLGPPPSYDTSTGPSNFSLGDVRSAVGMPTAEVKGSADLNVKVQVEPSDSFLSRIVSAVRNEINVFNGGVGTNGSTGLSMPEVIPSP